MKSEKIITVGMKQLPPIKAINKTESAGPNSPGRPKASQNNPSPLLV